MLTIEEKLIHSLSISVGSAELASSVHAGLENPATMSKAVYLGLQGLAEKMEMASAKGEDAEPGFDDAVAEVSRLQDLAPWTMHPDYGCVLRAEVEALDRAAEPASPRARSMRP